MYDYHARGKKPPLWVADSKLCKLKTQNSLPLFFNFQHQFKTSRISQTSSLSPPSFIKKDESKHNETVQHIRRWQRHTFDTILTRCALSWARPQSNLLWSVSSSLHRRHLRVGQLVLVACWCHRIPAIEFDRLESTNPAPPDREPHFGYLFED